MSEDEEDEKTLKYWKMKYKVIEEDYQKLKARSEQLETRLIEIVEQNESDESTSLKNVEILERKLEESNKRVEQLEAACVYYRSQCNGIVIKEPTEKDLKSLKLPVFEEGDGFIYGFRWKASSQIHIV